MAEAKMASELVIRAKRVGRDLRAGLKPIQISRWKVRVKTRKEKVPGRGSGWA